MIGSIQNTFSVNRLYSARPTAFKGTKTVDSYDYSGIYGCSLVAHNNTEPDQKIMDTIAKRFPDAKNTSIVDVGAGDGRNTIPLAEKGYKVFALETDKDGRRRIRQRAENLPEKVTKTKIGKNKYDVKIESQDRVMVSRFDITQSPMKTEKNVFVMSHVSQHFNSEKLETVLSNTEKSLCPGGIVVFDALVDQSGKPFENTVWDQKNGCCRFKEEDITAMAEKAGLKLVEKAPYSEKGAARPFYADYKEWGGKKTCKVDLDYSEYSPIIRPLAFVCKAYVNTKKALMPRRDVKLEWFVFEKPE